MKKVTPFPRRVEASAPYIQKLNAVADKLDELADAVRRQAIQIRQHAEALKAAQAGKQRGPTA